MMTKSKADQPLTIEQTIHAPIAQVWEAITTLEGIKQWFFDLKEFKPQKGFEFSFIGQKDGVKYIHHCQIREVIVNKKISYSWRYEGHQGDSLVTIELWAQGDETKLVLTHAGLESFPPTDDFARNNFLQGWTFITGSLKKLLEGSGDREIVISRLVDATRERVWEAWTDPKQVGQWWGPHGFTTTTQQMDVRPGGVWEHTMHGPDGTDYPNKAIFIEVVKPTRIVFSNAGGKKGAGVHFHSTWTFEAEGNQTRITIRMIFETATERDMVVKEYRAIEGAEQTLGRLAEYIAKRNK